MSFLFDFLSFEKGLHLKCLLSYGSISSRASYVRLFFNAPETGDKKGLADVATELRKDLHDSHEEFSLNAAF